MATPIPLAATEVVAPREPAANKAAFVASSEGNAIAGAQVSWTPTAPRLLASRWDWDEIDAEWLAASTTVRLCQIGRRSPFPMRRPLPRTSRMWKRFGRGFCN